MTSPVDLLNRSLGTLSPIEFTQIQNARLLEALQLQPWPRFGRQSMKKRDASNTIRHDAVAGTRSDSNSNKDNEAVGFNNDEDTYEHDEKEDDGGVGGVGGGVIAHRAGVNAIVIDRFEGR